MAGGDEILANGVTEILKGLSILVAKEIGLAWGVKGELQNLKKTLDMILAVMNDAEKKQVKNEAVRMWLEELKDIAYEAEDILDEHAYEILRQREMTRKRDRVSNFFSPNNKIVVSHQIAHQMKSINEKLNKHAVRKEELGLQMLELCRNSSPMDLDKTSKLREFRETDSMVDQSLKIIGRDKDKSNIIKMLLHNDSQNQDGNIQVIPIVGMGGLGKTTLAKQIFNDDTMKMHFHLKMWVCVSEEFNVKQLFMKITESITKRKCDDMSNVDVIVCKLQQHLNEKKYLLVLDDVWNKNSEEWVKLRRPLLFGGNGSKIIVTTRSDDVASVMGGKPYSYKLGILSEDESWSLFHKRTFGYLGGAVQTPTRTIIGKELVGKCKGLPLALIFLISLLWNKDEHEWKVINENKIWVQSYDDEDETRVLPILKLSYDHLPSHLKQCFSYFSLFDKDYCFDLNTMILLWMAEGFLPQPSGGNNISMEEFGNNYFNHLWRNSFFQDVEIDVFGQVESFSMHDLVHDLAKYVAGDRECLIWRADENMESILNVRRLRLFGKSERHSFKKIMAVFLNKSILRTLIVSDTSIKKIENNAFDGITRLRVLDLHDALKIEEISSFSLSNLKHLRYLNLKGTEIKKLPESVMSLFHLQTLDLRGCQNLKELPKGIGKLIKLRHLLLPEDISVSKEIRQLSSLQTLLQIDVGNSGRRERGCGIEVLEGLDLLNGELTINHLRNVISEMDAQRANLKRKKGLKKIHMYWRSKHSRGREDGFGGEYIIDEVVLEALQPHPNLKELFIDQYFGVKLPQWMGDPSCLPNLVVLQLMHCTCEQVLGFGKLPSLKELKLLNMYKIKCLGAGDGDGVGEVVLFPSLKILILENMASLEEWVDYIPSPTTPTMISSCSCFPCLENICIKRCPNLKITPTRFPSLKELTLDNINGKGAMPLIPTNINSLEIVELEKISELRFLPHCLLQGSNLKKLCISGCSDFQGFLPNEKEEGEGGFTSLKFLHLGTLPNLKFLPDIRSFTSLEELMIYDCESLKPLPEDLTCLSSCLEHLEHVEIQHVKDVEYFDWEKPERNWHN